MRLIDADALGIGRCNPDIFQNAAYASGWNGVINIMQSAPTIDAVPVVHGQWVEFWDEARGKRYGCSVCAASVAVQDDYCPHCGARMDGQEPIRD